MIPQLLPKSAASTPSSRGRSNKASPHRYKASAHRKKMSSPATSPTNEHHCFYATLDPQSKQTYARSKTPYCDTVLLTSVRSIWMPKMSCWLLCVAVGL